MKTVIFAVLIIAAVSVAFWAGHIIGPTTSKEELERLEKSQEYYREQLLDKEWASLNADLYLLMSIDKGDLAAAKSHLNTKIDFWMVENSAHAQKGPWLKPSDEPTDASSFVSRVARHRKEYPVDYDHKETEDCIDEILDAALQIEMKR
jgi:hypothetical protein